MFRTILIGPFFALTCLLGGCNQTTGKIDVSSVQAALKTACGFELIASEAATDIQSIVGANPWITSAAAVANLICQNVGNLTAGRRTAGMPMAVNVNGTVVHGKFVQ